MTANDQSLTLMGIPLEIRHNIFAMASVRDKGTKKVLRRWFEKQDVKAKVAQAFQDNPDGPAPRVVYGDESDDEVADPVVDEVGEDQEQDEEGDEENEDDSESEDDEAEDEEQDEENEDEMLEDEEAEEEVIEDESEGNEVDMEEPEQTEQTEQTATIEQDGTVGNGPDAMLGAAQSNGTGTAQPATDEDEAMSDDGETSDDHSAEEAEDDQGNNEEADESTGGDDTAANAEGDDGTAAQHSPPSAMVITPHRKWRHIPKFLRISGCPPPPELLLACKEMSREVKDWFYDVTIIRIDVSGSFAHTTMFETALYQIAESELSPFKNIRKVELMFVWDTEWIRNDAVALAVFPAMLTSRAQMVQQILQDCATELKQVTVHWYDSIRDNESAAFKYEVLDKLDVLPADIKVEEHYLEPGQKPRANTIAGKKRTEFQNIADSGWVNFF
ncbi:hypothetical protein K491DRAFT_400451 [Lophiostoma macrostomum CBS 122681]|uniref:Uncharacterized protein n=1 Tax=Lophiostoma macrostomum CBS 122681 TaxID=1314788 RepID=A0A6A6T9W0_9PLEO|nr:hypothetical protein K491DRAFT_400451 [Lophiostoma macrostomum CBS 122681]